MKNFTRTLLALAVAAAGAFGLLAHGAEPASACLILPMPSPPSAGAQLAPDCSWYDAGTGEVWPSSLSLTHSAGHTVGVEGTDLENITRAQESEAEHRDVPWIPIVVLAFAFPVAVLLVPSFLMRGHDASRDTDD